MSYAIANDEIIAELIETDALSHVSINVTAKSRTTVFVCPAKLTLSFN